MAERKQPNSRRLKDSTRLAIAKYKRDNPAETNDKIAAKFGVTREQVKNAWYAYRDKNITSKHGKRKDASEAQQVMTDFSYEQIISDEFHYAAAQLKADNTMPAPARVSLLKDLTQAKRAHQQTDLQAHIRSTDAGIIVRIVRRFLPNATTDDCIKIYMEEREAWNDMQAA